MRVKAQKLRRKKERECIPDCEYRKLRIMSVR